MSLMLHLLLGLLLDDLTAIYRLTCLKLEIQMLLLLNHA